MYAIIVDGGRQYKVEQGQELVIDYREASAGDLVTFDQVLAHGEGG
ncbi:MAG TPA: bL21 family ribosomal protein, partial [Pirellulales bacterium]|nr:bL21 family ribosomal protein [Pirellulales bacterium]